MITDITNREELHLLINDMQLHVGVEIGVQTGLYSKYLLENTNLFLNLVDIWKWQKGYNDVANVSDIQQDMNLEQTIERLKPFEGRYKIIRMYSIHAAKTFPDESLDFIYLDANHTYDAVTTDLNAWYPKLRIGGLMAGHDYLNAWPGEEKYKKSYEVETAVQEFISGKNIDLHITQEPWQTFYWVKNE